MTINQHKKYYLTVSGVNPPSDIASNYHICYQVFLNPQTFVLKSLFINSTRKTGDKHDG